MKITTPRRKCADIAHIGGGGDDGCPALLRTDLFSGVGHSLIRHGGENNRGEKKSWEVMTSSRMDGLGNTYCVVLQV